MNLRISIFFSLAIIFLSCSDIEPVEIKENGVLVESFSKKKSDGTKHGLYTRYFSNGKKSEETQYENGKINGPQIFYHENGKVSESANYINDEYAGEYKKYFESGKLEQEYNYSNGAINGEFKGYYPNGKLKEIVAFKDNEEYGPFKEYHENGNLKTEGMYKGSDPDSAAALEDGELKKYDEQGVHFQTMNCSLGRCSTTWLKEGVVLED